MAAGDLAGGGLGLQPPGGAPGEAVLGAGRPRTEGGEADRDAASGDTSPLVTHQGPPHLIALVPSSTARGLTKMSSWPATRQEVRVAPCRATLHFAGPHSSRTYSIVRSAGAQGRSMICILSSQWLLEVHTRVQNVVQ